MNAANYLLVAATAVTLAGCAVADRPAIADRDAGQCFHADRVNSFHAAGPYTVDVRVGTRDYYRLGLAGNCRDLNWSTKVVLKARSSPWICRAYDAELVVPDPMAGVNSCPIASVRKLTEAEAEIVRNR